MERSRREVSGSNSVVECNPSKFEVAGSIPVSRSNILRYIMFILSREDRSPSHPTGWVKIGKFATMEQAKTKETQRESMMRWQYSDKNPDRQYHCIEEILK